MTSAAQTSPGSRWHHRARHALAHSLRVRLVALFLLLALAMAATFLFGMQKAFSIGWRDAARPLLVDYVDRLAAEIGSIDLFSDLGSLIDGALHPLTGLDHLAAHNRPWAIISRHYLAFQRR